MRLLLILSFFAILAGGLRAETVRILSTGGKSGEGWMFLDQDGSCKVVTAAHVIRRINGSVGRAEVVDGQGRTLQTGPPVLVSSAPGPDIAVLPVLAVNDPSFCREGRLSGIGVARRVEAMTQATVVTTDHTDIKTVPVDKRETSMDQDRGGVFSVRPTIADDQVVEGWSGSVVQDSEGPLGIVYAVDPKANEALAIRVDVVRRLMADAQAPATAMQKPTGKVPSAVILLAGTTPDAEAGPDHALNGDHQSWRVQPRKNSVVFVAAFADPTQIRQVTLTANPASAGRITGVEIASAASAFGDDWVVVNYCRLRSDEASIVCPFLIRTVSRIRLVMKISGADAVAVDRLTVD